MQETIDKILSEVKLPITFHLLKKIDKEFYFSEDATDDSIKLSFYFPVKISVLGTEQIVSDAEMLKKITRLEDHGFKIVFLKISDQEKTFEAVTEEGTRLMLNLKSNHWRLQKKRDFHIECFEDYLDIWWHNRRNK